MKAFDMIEIAKTMGFKTNHFLRMIDVKSGVEVAGVFTKYKQHKTNGLRLKADKFEVEVITDGKANFTIVQSEEVKTENENNGN